MAAGPSSAIRLLLRLYRDLEELKDHPYPGVTVFTDEANLREICLILVPPTGPFKDLSLHFDVSLPDNWPASPPNVKASMPGIDHPNLFGSHICCDLLKHSTWGKENYTGGYSPALTLQGLFLQFLTFFSSTRIDQEDGGYVDMGDHVLANYMHDEELASRRVFLVDSSYSQDPCYSSCGPQEQWRREKEWLDCPSEEILEGRFSCVTSEERVTHKHKYLPVQDKHIHNFERVNPRWTATFNAILHWKCKKCRYGWDPMLGRRDVGLEEENPSISISAHFHLSLLSDDILAEIASHLPADNILSFGTAYPRFQDIVKSFHILRQKELYCFSLRTPLRDCILGIGIESTDGHRMLSSEFDWLSLEAFETFRVRQSIMKRTHAYFLPLAFNAEHFQRAEKYLWNRLSILDDAPQEAEDSRGRGRRRVTGVVHSSTLRSSPWDFSKAPSRPPPDPGRVHVLYKMMNGIVVNLMKTCYNESENRDFQSSSASASKDKTLTTSVLRRVSEKAITSYCQLFHLLLCLCREHPTILREAKEKVRLFSRDPDARLKSQTPDLGEFIVLIILVAVAPELSGDVSGTEAPPS